MYGEKTRYATLQRLRTSNSQHGSHHHPNGGYETLRPNGSSSTYNVPSLVSFQFQDTSIEKIEFGVITFISR